MQYLADSTLLLDYYRRCDQAKHFFDKMISGDINVCISVITESEIWVGIKDDKELRYWITLLESIESIELNSNIAREAGEIYRNYGHYMGKEVKMIFEA